MSIHGYQEYQPRDFTQQVIRASRNILIEYEAWDSPLTVRQVFYRLVAEYSYAKTEKAYGALVGYIARSRRAYQHRVLELFNARVGSYQDAVDEALKEPLLIPFSWIRDERGHTKEVQSFADVQDFLGTVERAISSLQKDRQEGQPQVLELWCEAAGMVPLMSEIARPYGIRVSSGGGYDSVTAKHKLAQRIERRAANNGSQTMVLHVGDFDPSGEGMYHTLVDDVGEMARQLIGEDSFAEFHRVALTEEQVIEKEVETAPPKPLDSRRREFVKRHPRIRKFLGTDDITAQLEALTPPELRTMIVGAIEDYLDPRALAEVEEEELELREEIRERLRLEA